MIDRYLTDEMEDIFSPEAKMKSWLRAEKGALVGWKEEGTLPVDDFHVLYKLRHEDLSWDRVKEIEEKTKHEMAAFVDHLEELIDDPETRWLHFGLTSSDILDTGLSLRLRDASNQVIMAAHELKSVIDEKSVRWKDIEGMGRSHGIHGERLSYGKKARAWADMVRRAIQRLDDAADDLAVGQFSGAMGNYQTVPEEVEKKACKWLNLKPVSESTQVIPRDLHAHYINVLAEFGGVMEKIATDLRLLHQTEIDEVREDFGDDQKGSSSMPHKHNPILSENVCGLARQLRSFSAPAMENISLWHERDMSHSSVERHVIPQAHALAEFGAKRLARVLRNLDVQKDHIEENANIIKGLEKSQSVMLHLIEKHGLSRKEAYRKTQKAAQAVEKEEMSFREAVRETIDELDTEDFECLFH